MKGRIVAFALGFLVVGGAPLASGSLAHRTFDLEYGDALLWRFNVTDRTFLEVRGMARGCASSNQTEMTHYSLSVVDGKASGAPRWRESWIGTATDQAVVGAAGTRVPHQAPSVWERCDVYRGDDRYVLARRSYTYVFVTAYSHDRLDLDVSLREGEVLSEDVQIVKATIVRPSEAQQGAAASTPLFSATTPISYRLDTQKDVIGFMTNGGWTEPRWGCSRNGGPCPADEANDVVSGKGPQTWDFWRDLDVRQEREGFWLALVELPSDDHLE